LTNLSSVSPRHTEYRPYLLNSAIVFSISQIVPFIAYWYIANYTVIPTEYMANLTAKCPPHTIARVFHERAFPYIGKTALGYFAYLGILTHHKLLTSNTTNQGTDLWRSLVRLGLSALLCSLFLWQL